MKTVSRDLRHGRSVSIVTYPELAADPDSWDGLMANALTTHPHYSRHVMAAHRRAGLAAADLAFVVVQGRLGLDALLPFACKRDVSGLGTRIARPFLSPFITQTSPLVADSPDLPEILDLLVTGLQSVSKGRIWRWPLLPTETTLGLGLLEAMDRAGWKRGIASHFERPIMERRGSYAAFLDEHPRRSRMKDLRRRFRNLSKRGALSHHVAIDGEGLNDAVSGFLKLEKAGWKGRAGTAIACRPEHEAFAHALFAPAGGPVRVRADSLLLDDRPLAISLAVLAGKTATLLKTTYDENERSSAPGLLLEAQIIEALYETGFAERLDSATLAGSVLEDLFLDTETICEIVAVPREAARIISVDQRIRLISMERRAKDRIKRVLGRR